MLQAAATSWEWARKAHLDDRVLGGLGDLLHEALGDGRPVLLEDGGCLVEELRSLPQRGLSPRLLCRLRRLHDLVHLHLRACWRGKGRQSREDARRRSDPISGANGRVPSSETDNSTAGRNIPSTAKGRCEILPSLFNYFCDIRRESTVGHGTRRADCFFQSIKRNNLKSFQHSFGFVKGGRTRKNREIGIHQRLPYFR